MKIISKLSSGCRLFLLSFTGCLIQAAAWAQDKEIDVNLSIDKGQDDWYKQPWVWVVGAAVFILLFVAIIRGGKKS